METDERVEKTKTSFFHTSLQNAAAFRTVPTGSAAVNQQNNKTGQIICYKNRTFPFATDSCYLCASVSLW